MFELDGTFLAYLILPYTNEEVIREDQPLCEGILTTFKKTVYHDHVFYDRKLEREKYLAGKFLPSFGDTTVVEHDFELGPKKIDSALLTDVKRIDHCIQHEKVPRELTIDDKGVQEVFKALYRIAEYEDSVFYKISQMYNQKIGIDLVRLARFSLDQDIQMPKLDNQHAHLDIFREMDIDDRVHVFITAFITGTVFDLQQFEELPIRFRVEARYDLTDDICTHNIFFHLLND